MTAIEIYRMYLDELITIYPKNEAENIRNRAFESLASISRSELIKNPTSILSNEINEALLKGLAQLKQQKPLQYILGESWFYKLPFKVSPAVLIPRPETEELVELAIDFLEKQGIEKKVLDIGTGSGCIPISIKKSIEGSNITSIDISADALTIAIENALTHATEINFLQCDFLEEKNWEHLDKYDVIISNPPYIPEEEKKLLDKNVTLYEPHLALFVEDKHPLIFYKKIADFGKTHLEKNGIILLETHENYADKVADLFNNKGYLSTIKKDMYDKKRMVIATHCR